MLKEGRPAPAAALLDLDGAPATLDARRAGRPALLFFYKADCPTSPLAARVLRRFAALPGLAVFGVAQDPADDAQAFAGAVGWGAEIDLVVDPEPWAASDAFGIVATPTWVLLDAAGRAAGWLVGWNRDAVVELAATAAALCSGRAPEVVRPGDGLPPWKPG